MTRSSYIFQSSQLGFRNWRPSDIPLMIEISGNKKVMEFFPAEATPQQTNEFIARNQALYLAKGYCYFAVEVLASEEFIGFIGLADQTYEADFTPCTDIGWRLKPTAWGRGYATEGAQQCLDYAFNKLYLDRIIATAPEVNLRSQNVMQKIGMIKLKNFVHPNLVANKQLRKCVVYEILNSTNYL